MWYVGLCNTQGFRWGNVGETPLITTLIYTKQIEAKEVLGVPNGLVYVSPNREFA